MPKHNELVDRICQSCGKISKVRYRPSRHSKPGLCLSCAIKKVIADGTLRLNTSALPSGEAVSRNNKRLWQDPQYRHKILSQRKARYPKRIQITCACGKVYEVNRRYAKRRRGGVTCCSCAMLRRWEDLQYREHISSMVKAQALALWQQPAFRQAVTDGNRKAWDNRRAELSDRSKALWQNSEYRNKLISGMANAPRCISNLQVMLYKMLDVLGVSYHKEGPETAIGFYAFDCLVPRESGGLLIECQGDYWHSLENAQHRDRSKFTYISKYFPEYEVMYIWEHEFYTKDRVLDRLKLKLGLAVETVDFSFSDITLGDVDNKALRSFLDSYHYIGAGRWGQVFGAYHGQELVATVVFSAPLRQNIAQQFGAGKVVELSRLCIHPSYHKKNFASWLIARVLRRVDADVVVAYSDTTVGHRGTVYEASNFKLHHEVDPDYWYVDRQSYVMHKKTLYARAVKMGMKEAEFAEKNNYLKQYGGPKRCYVKII